MGKRCVLWCKMELVENVARNIFFKFNLNIFYALNIVSKEFRELCTSAEKTHTRPSLPNK